MLPEVSVANQGIHSDIGSGLAARLPEVIRLKPALCFVEVGTNDIDHKIPIPEIMRNLKTIVDGLRKEQVEPVLQTVTRVCDHYHDSTFNATVNELNGQIRKRSKEWATALIDLDSMTDSAGFLPRRYALSDGCHYAYPLYKLWAGAVQKTVADRKR